MEKEKSSGEKTQKKLLKQMTASSSDIVSAVVRFANDDVPRYFEMLDNFENRPSKTRIVVR